MEELGTFEWYADFETLLPHFQDGLIEGDAQRIFIPGCGNSLLSEKLCTSMNQTRVTSIDFVPECVVKMNERNVPGVTYTEGDFLKTGFEDKAFDCIIDKGSFDAICLDSDPESKQSYNEYLIEQLRVLDPTVNGRFLIVSLLQAHVLVALLDFFVRGEGNTLHEGYVFDLEVRKLAKMTEVQESKFVPFLLCFTKRTRDGDNTTPSKLSLKKSLEAPA